MARTTKTTEPTDEQIIKAERVAYLETIIEENQSLFALTGEDQHREWAKEAETELKTLKDGE